MTIASPSDINYDELIENLIDVMTQEGYDYIESYLGAHSDAEGVDYVNLRDEVFEVVGQRLEIKAK